MTRDEIDAIIAPKDESRQLVFEWLGNHSLANSAVLTPRGNIVVVNATVSQAEQLLGTKYNGYSKRLFAGFASRGWTVD